MAGGNLIFLYRVKPKDKLETLITVEAPDSFRAAITLATEMPGVFVIALIGAHRADAGGTA